MALFRELGVTGHNSTTITELYVGEAPAIAAVIDEYVVQFDV